MSNTKIVIDKEQKNGIVNKMLQKIIDTLPVKPVFEGDVLIALHDELLDVLTEHSTEIQIDQSIEDAAKEYLNKNCLIGTRYKKVIYEVSSFDLLEFSKQQQIIEQLRVKEKVSELNKCFEKGNQECDGAHCQGCWKDIVRSVIKSLTKINKPINY